MHVRELPAVSAGSGTYLTELCIDDCVGGAAVHSIVDIDAVRAGVGNRSVGIGI